MMFFFSRLACALTPVPHVSHRILTQHPRFFFRNTLVQRYLKQLFLDPFGSLWNYIVNVFLGFARWMLKKSSKTIPQHFAEKKVTSH